MERYEIATLQLAMGGAAKAAPAIEEFCSQSGAKGKLLGAFATEVGPLNQVILLRGFDSEDDFNSERQRTLNAANPFGASEWMSNLVLDSYIPFPFLKPVEAGEFGPIYEMRSYVYKHGGLPHILKAWENAVPAREKISPLTIALYSIDGEPRITHIWPFKNASERFDLRSESVKQGVWPPVGGPQWLTSDMRSLLAVPLSISPLR
ncbi:MULTISPECIES: NIPSNAP family protein [unclassified Bartonella]|uniref:NIPSNAP family protein n=1 Tax=unclassified Bartonella TaxID=2645622 RepID=UPI0021C72399|nr:MULTISPECIES: NIPSNAP family protein [unclassified Bartonella]UXM95378.1 NIPSNAP family protein [Bartonella sp. HY329]UXN06442.1 NIPSNAP family protein [Bartonella sp. HY761]UXN09703.1 NIPSNAP family protein [Bartonella sp. HY328]